MILNIIKGMIDKWYWDRFIIYTVPFLIVIIIYFIRKNTLKLDPYIFFACALLCILAGNWGNLSATSFLIFAFYAISKIKKMIFIFLGFLILTIILKFVFLIRDGTIIDTVVYLIGFEFILFIYFNMIHPKKENIIILLNEDEINKTIIRLLTKGYRNKEIANIVNLSTNAITKRIENMRIKYRCKTNEEMIFRFTKNKKITLI